MAQILWDFISQCEIWHVCNSPVHCRTAVINTRLLSCVLTVPKQLSSPRKGVLQYRKKENRVIVASLRVTYDLLRYSTIFMQMYGGLVTTSVRVFLTTVWQCVSFVRVRARSAKKPYKWGSIQFQHRISTLGGEKLTNSYKTGVM